MGSKYTTQASSGYNASPPSDDGSTTEANKVKWSTIKTKLTDTLKTFGESINSALVTALDHSARSVTISDTAVASDNERVIEVKTSSVNITLSDATTMAAGYMVSIANQSTGSITVSLATSTDTIDMVTNATVTISAKSTLMYIVNAAANGYITKSSYGNITLRTEVASTSGTSIDFTGIPNGVKRVTIGFVGVSTSGTSNLLLQIGDSGGAEDTGYQSGVGGLSIATPVSVVSSTAGMILSPSTAASTVFHGQIILTLEDSSDNTWTGFWIIKDSGNQYIMWGAGSKALSAVLDRVRVTTVGGSDTFDAGAINISFER